MRVVVPVKVLAPRSAVVVFEPFLTIEPVPLMTELETPEPAPTGDSMVVAKGRQ